MDLGCSFDSFDNDNKRNNPYIMGMANDGNLVYDHEHDGSSQQMGGCLRDFRNKPFPIRAKIEYFKNVLTVLIHNGMTDNERDYEMCYRAENVFLPPKGYFGVTAATGGLADDHDVLRLLVHSLRSADEMAQLRLNQEEEEKFQKEFEQYQQKTQKARDEYIAQHPDAARKEEELYETSEQRELRQIFEGQGQIYDFIKQLNVKLDEVIGRQERTLSLVSGGQIAVGQGGTQVPPPSGGMGGNDIGVVLSNQREIAQNARDIKTIISDVQSISQQLLNRAQGSVQPVGGSYDFHVTLKELNEGINIVKPFFWKDLETLPLGETLSFGKTLRPFLWESPSLETLPLGMRELSILVS
ncbi:Protein ERGIC-53 [Armadillidium nasatum]|uniref:Protein ERGIC-53 n=1 Tax=Armadillidium nasatum TaxID=96803 RepID=A0A5N5SR57_9CRUS|nr:Protein ERGIC-53 [Armadillidium nasatum]